MEKEEESKTEATQKEKPSDLSENEEKTQKVAEIDAVNLVSNEEEESGKKVPNDESNRQRVISASSEGEEKKSKNDLKDQKDERKKSATTASSTRTLSSSDSGSASAPTHANAILFYGVTYLGCSSVNAPKSEAEINRIMTTLNEQATVTIEVTMAMPQTIDDKIVLYDVKSGGESKIAEYKMSHVLFVVRGAKNSSESACFAFTTCHGDSTENLIFSCHVFRCNLVEAVSKILYSFWSVFNRYKFLFPLEILFNAQF